MGKRISVIKAIIYCLILSVFISVLIGNWRNMRLSWFKEFWEFLDFKAIVEYIENNLSAWIFVGVIILVFYKLFTGFCRAKNVDCNSKNVNETHDSDDLRGSIFLDENIKKMHEQREEALRSSPGYDFMPNNVSYRTIFQKMDEQ